MSFGLKKPKTEKPNVGPVTRVYRTSYIEKRETDTKNSKEIEPQTNMNREDAKDAKGFGQD